MDVPQIKLWDKHLVEVGYVGNPISLSGTLCHNGIGTLGLTLATRDSLTSAMCQAGVRMTIDYRGEQIFSGPMRSFQIDSAAPDSTTQATFEDDFRLFSRMLAFATPSATISTTKPTASQTTAYDVSTGPAETVLKDVLRRNLARKSQPVPVTIAPDLKRGATITAKSRNYLMSDYLVPLVDAAGLGIEVRQGATGLVVDVYEPGTYPDTLTDGPGGVIQSWSASCTGPTASYWLAGWTGENEKQLFLEYTNGDRESWWGDHIESYLDLSSASTAADVTAAITQAGTDSHEQTGITIALRSDGHYAFGSPTGLRKGQTVNIATGGVTRTDVLRQIAVSWDVQNGFSAQPTIGDISGSTQRQLFHSVAIIAKRIRNLGR